MGEASLPTKQGTRLRDAATAKPEHSRLSRHLKPVVRIVVLLGLVTGTVWLLGNDKRGADIATVLGSLVGALSLLVTVRMALHEFSSAGASPETNGAPRRRSRAALGRSGGIAVAYGIVLVVMGPPWSSTSETPGATSGPTTAPATPAATPPATPAPAAPLPSQVPGPAVAAPSGPQPIPGRIDPSQPAINPPPGPGSGDPGPMGPRPVGPPPPHHPPPPPQQQVDFGPAGTGVSCSSFTDPAVRIKAITAADGLPGIATHNFIDLEVLRANRPGHTYWIIAHLIGANGDGSPYIAKQQVRNSAGTESYPLQLNADINSVREIYLVEADPGGTSNSGRTTSYRWTARRTISLSG